MKAEETAEIVESLAEALDASPWLAAYVDPDDDRPDAVRLAEAREAWYADQLEGRRQLQERGQTAFRRMRTAEGHLTTAREWTPEAAR